MQWSIALLVAAILALIILAKFVKAVGQALFFGGIIVFVAGILLTAWVVRDAKEFKERFPAEPKTFLLVNNDTVLAGFVQGGNRTEYYNGSGLTAARALFAARNLSGLRGSSYKLIIFNLSVFDWGRNYTLPEEGPSVNGGVARALLLAADPLPPLKDLYVQRAQDLVGGKIDTKAYEARLAEQFPDGAVAKGKLFNAVAQESLQGENMLLVLRGLREESVTVDPEGAVFRVLKHAPAKVFPNETAVFPQEGAGS